MPRTKSASRQRLKYKVRKYTHAYQIPLRHAMQTSDSLFEYSDPIIISSHQIPRISWISRFSCNSFLAGLRVHLKLRISRGKSYTTKKRFSQYDFTYNSIFIVLIRILVILIGSQSRTTSNNATTRCHKINTESGSESSTRKNFLAASGLGNTTRQGRQVREDRQDRQTWHLNLTFQVTCAGQLRNSCDVFILFCDHQVFLWEFESWEKLDNFRIFYIFLWKWQIIPSPSSVVQFCQI